MITLQSTCSKCDKVVSTTFKDAPDFESEIVCAECSMDEAMEPEPEVSLFSKFLGWIGVC